MPEMNVASDIRAVVWKIEVAVGDTVSAGQDLLILESMKTEIPVTAPEAGVVAALLVGEGDEVAEQQTLVVLRS